MNNIDNELNELVMQYLRLPSIEDIENLNAVYAWISWLNNSFSYVNQCDSDNEDIRSFCSFLNTIEFYIKEKIGDNAYHSIQSQLKKHEPPINQ